MMVLMAKRRNECRELHCMEPLFMGGLCKRHHEESETKRRRHDAALAALHAGVIDGEPIPPGALRDEFWRVRDWWFDVCTYVNSEREHPVLRDETAYATSWCIGLAEYIIDEVRDVRAGEENTAESHEYRRRHLWERFENLSRGLMSNGVARPVRT
jgi:hypothetical protein